LVNSAFQKVSTRGGRLPQEYGEGGFYLAAFGIELYTAEKLSVSECNRMLSTQRLLQIIVVLGATVIMKLFS
jgi:hypothetical protein